jgi:tRNA(Ile)-lysidine synthase
VPRSRLVATLEALSQPWIEDPSNADPRFARARLRKLMPALAAEGMTAERLAETAKRFRRARTALESAAADLHCVAVREDATGYCRLDRNALAAAPEEVGLRVLARLLMGVGGSDYPPRLDRLERLHAMLAGEGDVPGATLLGCRIAVVGDEILVMRETGRTGLPVARLQAPGTMVWDRRFRIDVVRKIPREVLTVRALGVDGVARVRESSRLRDIPIAAARAAPGVFAGDRLVAAPLVEAAPGPYSPRNFSVLFIGASRFAAAMIPEGDLAGELTRRRGAQRTARYLSKIENR